MKTLLLSDIHLADKPPSSCTPGYADDLLGLLRQTVVLAESREVDAVCWAGDVFHVKNPSRTSHRLVQRVIEVVQSYPCLFYIVVGNHDIVSDRLESVDDTQPLGVLFRAGARRLEGWAEDDLALYGVPWMQDWSEAGIGEELERWRIQVFQRGTGSRHPLVVTHAPIYPPGKELPYENTPASWWAQAMGNAGSLFYGHIHDDHGVFTVDGVQFCNHGALSRGSLTESDLTRQVGATLWDSETGTFEFIPLDARPSSEVFRIQEKGKAVASQAKLSDFLASIGSAQLPVMSVEAVISHIGSMDIDPEVRALAAELLEEAAHGGMK